MLSRLQRAAAAIAAIGISACADAGLRDIHRMTSPLTDMETNLEVWGWGWRSPKFACQRLDLPPAVQAWIRAPAAESAPGAPFTSAIAPRRIINTDVDDTVIAKFWDRERYPRDSVYPGVLDLLAAQGDALVVLTARSSGEQALRDRFCGLFNPHREAQRGCPGIAVSLGRTENLVDSVGMGLVKAEALLAEIDRSPGALVAFNGDSGQGDWIAALVVRDLAGDRLRYAAIHDVRAWSLEHRIAIRNDLADREDLERIYRARLGLPEGSIPPAERARLDDRLRAIRAVLDAALTGPHGRLNGAALRAHGVFLHRSYAALALDLADAHLIADDAADRVLRKAVPELCFAPENDLGFDSAEERRRLVERLAARAATRPGSATARGR